MRTFVNAFAYKKKTAREIALGAATAVARIKS